MTYQGCWRADGTFVGFDYSEQAWVEQCKRDPTAPLGSACNPIAEISARDDIFPD